MTTSPPSTPTDKMTPPAPSLTYSDATLDPEDPPVRPRRASTRLITQAGASALEQLTGQTTAELVNRCCGGTCCGRRADGRDNVALEHVEAPDNDAYKSLGFNVVDIPVYLTGVDVEPEQKVFLRPVGKQEKTLPRLHVSTEGVTVTPAAVEEVTESLNTLQINTKIQPPSFVQPHPPYSVFPARLHSARELTKPGAEKRTYHFDIDVTGYPAENNVDFRVGGAIGVMAPNEEAVVDELMDLLCIPRFLRDKPVLVETTGGRWPTVWGEEEPRKLVSTRRELLTWCSDVQSTQPSKELFQLMALYAVNPNEQKILRYLISSEGTHLFNSFRAVPNVTIAQVLSAFPSAVIPLDRLLSILPQLMPRFYSLSNDPHDSYISTSCGKLKRRVIEIAVTVHEAHDWKHGQRTGVGSGFFERQARNFLAQKAAGVDDPVVYIPMFKGLMQNPLAKEFVSDGPMLLIGAGVGIAPFRGFVQRRLKTANCANKVWVLQGIRDSSVDEIYGGEWGIHEDKVKQVVESRKGTGRYVQEEVREQADLVWHIINSQDGRVFVCGSSRGMGEGVEMALQDVAMEKANLSREAAKEFWDLRKKAGQYIAETW